MIETAGGAGPDDSAAALDALLERLAGVLSGGAAGGEPTEGTDADGLVHAKIGGDGRVAGLDLDPKLARDPSRIAAAIVEAVNAALVARPAARSHSEMTAELQQIQEQSLTVTQALNAALLASLERLKGSAP